MTFSLSSTSNNETAFDSLQNVSTGSGHTPSLPLPLLLRRWGLRSPLRPLRVRTPRRLKSLPRKSSAAQFQKDLAEARPHTRDYEAHNDRGMGTHLNVRLLPCLAAVTAELRVQLRMRLRMVRV